MRNFICNLLILSFIVKTSLQDIKVINPKYLAVKVQIENKGAEGEILSRNGKFGEIPYGKTIIGNLYVHDLTSSTNNDWCNSEKYSFIDYSLVNDNIKTPIIAIANDDNCPFAQKAMNVQNAGGNALIIHTKNSFYDWEKNVDDYLYGDNLRIPTKIITYTTGQKLIDAVVNLYKQKLLNNNNNLETVVLSLSYKNFISSGQDIEFALYFRSDQVKAANFFTEFSRYKNLLAKRFKFAPYYHYYICNECNGPYTTRLDDELDEGCIGSYCGIVNHDLNIKNPKLVTLENLRQKCIYELYPLDFYWNYMISFDEICFSYDHKLTEFNQECISKVLSTVEKKQDSFNQEDNNRLTSELNQNNYLNKIKVKNYEGKFVFSEDAVNECMELSVAVLKLNSNDNLFKNDIEAFKTNKVHRYPVIELNGIKYKASWSAKHIFNSICAALGEGICKQEYEFSEAYVKQEKSSVGLILLVTLGIIIIMLIIALCYRRYVNKLIESSIEQRIYKQTQESIGNYSKMEKDIYG